MDINDLNIQLEKLSNLNFTNWKESDIREDFIKPLLNCLGYEKNTSYDINREDQHLLNKQFIMVGRSKIQIDYKLVIRKKSFWLIEAKSAEKKEISIEEIFQAQLYAIHPEVNAFYFMVTNGWEIKVYKTDSLDVDYAPILSIKNNELISKFQTLNNLLGAKNIITHLKDEVLDKISKIFSVELNVDKLESFSNQVRNTLNSLKPTINDNIRNVRKEKEKEHENEVIQFYKNTETKDLLQYLTCFPTNFHQLYPLYSTIKDRITENNIAENTNLIKYIIQLFLGRPSNNQRRNLILLLLNIYINFKDSFNSKNDNVSIQDNLYYMIFQSIAGFPQNKLFQEISRLDGNLHRVVYKMSICNSDLVKNFEKSVHLKKTILDDEELIFQNPHLARERLQWVENTIFTLFNKFCRLNVDEIQNINKILEIFEKESINDEFDVEFPKIINTDKSDLSFYSSYNDTFDYYRSGIFSHLYNYYDSIEPIINESIIKETKELTKRKYSNEKYNVNYADYFLYKHWLRKQKLKISSDEQDLISKILISKEYSAHISYNSPKSDPMYKMSGKYQDKYYIIYFNPDLDEEVLNITKIEETK